MQRDTMRRRSFGDRFFPFLCWLSASLSIVTTLGIVGMLAFELVQFFSRVSLWEFLTDTQWTPLFAEKHFGILPLLAGTFLTSVIAMAIAGPLGLVIALYLSEYVNPRLKALLKPALEILAGIPTVVYGYFALLVVTPFLQRYIPNLSGFNALSPGIVMGIMILPIVVSLSDDALSSVPKSLREAGLALGANRLRVAFTIVLPAGASGVVSALILGISRAIGETMIVAIAAGQVPSLTLDPRQPIETMTAFIVQVSLGDVPTGTLEYQTIFAVGGVLFLLTMIFNLIAYTISRRFHYAHL